MRRLAQVLATAGGLLALTTGAGLIALTSLWSGLRWFEPVPFMLLLGTGLLSIAGAVLMGRAPRLALCALAGAIVACAGVLATGIGTGYLITIAGATSPVWAGVIGVLAFSAAEPAALPLLLVSLAALLAVFAQLRRPIEPVAGA